MINFLKYRLIYLIVSLLIVLPGLFTIIRFGFKPAIDFTGGTLMEIKFDDESKNPSVDDIKRNFETSGIEVGSIQTSAQKTYIARTKPMTPEQRSKLTEALISGNGTFTELRYENVGPTLGKELLQKTVIASLLAILAILFYIAWSFKNIRYGISAIIALIHDVLVVVSVFAILGVVSGVEVDSLFVTAILTTMSFSVHDTIVVFDRIREMQKRGGQTTFEQKVNQALTETMGRSLNNSLTIVFMLLALFLLGGESIKWFALALLVGTTSGTYSSPFIAAPVLYTWHKLRDKGR